MAWSRQLAWTPPLVNGLVTLAWIRQARGDRAGALDAIGEAERVQLSPEIVGLINPVPAERARLALAHGDVDVAVRWARARRLAATDDPGYPREREYLAKWRSVWSASVIWVRACWPNSAVRSASPYRRASRARASAIAAGTLATRLAARPTDGS